MPDETPTPSDSTSSPQVADTQAPPSEPVSAPVIEPTPPPEAAAPAPETPPTETPAQAEVSEAVSEPQTPQAQPEPVQTNPPAPQTEPPPFAKEELKSTGVIVELLTKARAKIQERRKKKLEKIMTKLSETGKITNDEVQKLLRVSDATATRYLDLLEKEGKIRQEGKTGKYVVYVRI